MATQREIKKRINSVKNIRKITRTMEMVSTARSKKMTNRVVAARPFATKIRELVSSVSALASIVSSPLLRRPKVTRRVALLVITGNRGLCGGYNSNVCRLARARMQVWQSDDVEVDLYVIGKKGASYFRFNHIPIKQVFTHIDEKAGYPEAEELGDLFLKEFESEKIDAVEIISTVFQSSASQTPEVTPVLPFHGENSEEVNDNIIYEPSPGAILQSLLPRVVKMAFLKAILEAKCSEEIARRIAMKSATDAAGDMIKSYTRSYNRVRQAKITQEISEIVAGADSLG